MKIIMQSGPISADLMLSPAPLPNTKERPFFMSMHQPKKKQRTDPKPPFHSDLKAKQAPHSLLPILTLETLEARVVEKLGI